MNQARSLSRRSLVLFVVAMLTTLSELGWWTWLNLRSSAKERRDHLERLSHDAELAERMVDAFVARDVALGDSPEHARERQMAAATDAFAGVTFEHGHAALRIDAAVDVERRFASHVRMFVAEGSVFALVLMFGAWLIWRAMRQEMFIVRQSHNFLSAVTHELKSPLASLRLWIETLERRPPAADEWKRPLAIMHADVDRLETLIGNVLLAARIEGANKPEAQRRAAPGALDAVACLTGVVEQMRPQAQERGLSLHVQVAPPVGRGLWVAIEPPAFELLARNLIDNAIKYSGQATRIDIALRPRGTHLELLVTDYGIGLVAAEQARIFDKFYRVGDEMVRQSAGTGLGLFLVRAVVLEHGGDVRVQSVGPGLGSQFCVLLPLCAAPAVRDA